MVPWDIIIAGMKPRVLLINPPVYDFAAYDFWLKPLGLLTVAGRIAPFAGVVLFDYLDRMSDSAPGRKPSTDAFGRGRFPSERIGKPSQFAGIPRYYRRYGLPRADFVRFLRESDHFEFALIGCAMTYWYPGVAEVIDDLREYSPDTTIVLGGFYAQACPDHAAGLGADMVISTPDLSPLFNALGICPEAAAGTYHPPLWQAYRRLESAAVRLTSGCPFKCTYCWTGQRPGGFAHRPLAECITDLEILLDLGVRDIAFYDDALLYEPEATLIPFMRHIIDNNIQVRLHTPNALHARLVTAPLARMMVEAGFKTFYLGFESASRDFQERTGSKVSCGQLESAVAHLLSAGARAARITVYEILGHPDHDLQQLEESMRFAHNLGIGVMLSDFSPIPGTPDGEKCRRWVDLDEPLNHNKTAFPIVLLGSGQVNRLKNLCRQLNSAL